MSQRLAGKTAFVTAAGAGIGRATALAFAREGARVIATDLKTELLAEVAGTPGLVIEPLDALDAAAIADAARRHPGVDVLFNAAGYVHHNTVLDCTEEQWDFAFDLNVRSMYRTIKAFLPGMLERGNGSIVNVASGASSVKGAANRFVYGATKAAVIGRNRRAFMAGDRASAGRLLWKHQDNLGRRNLATRPRKFSPASASGPRPNIRMRPPCRPAGGHPPPRKKAARAVAPR
jgi:NAD(P)-dependent dehydrogenase (short-subunit alcohol dehydrogenase family)